ncbi:MAG: metal-dependent hydrolase, partial [Thermoguttaceae bacterium]
MADFKTHVRFSTAAGVVYGTGLGFLGLPVPTCVLAGGVCSLAGMFPDIDSNSSRALQECLYLAAGLTSMLTIGRLREFPISDELVIIIGAAVFLFVRYGVGAFVRRFTVHRGMLHSIPVAFIFGLLSYMLFSGPFSFRVIKAAGITLGYLSHLCLDEIYSVDLRGVRLKKSFGTALKFFDFKSPKKTFFTYTLLFALGFCAAEEPKWSPKANALVNRLAGASGATLSKISTDMYSDKQNQEKWDEAVNNLLMSSFGYFDYYGLYGAHQDAINTEGGHGTLNENDENGHYDDYNDYDNYDYFSNSNYDGNKQYSNNSNGKSNWDAPQIPSPQYSSERSGRGSAGSRNVIPFSPAASNQSTRFPQPDSGKADSSDSNSSKPTNWLKFELPSFKKLNGATDADPPPPATKQLNLIP